MVPIWVYLIWVYLQTRSEGDRWEVTFTTSSRLRLGGRFFATANASPDTFRVKRPWRRQRHSAQRLSGRVTVFRSTCRDRSCTKLTTSYRGRRGGTLIQSNDRLTVRHRRQAGRSIARPNRKR